MKTSFTEENARCASTFLEEAQVVSASKVHEIEDALALSLKAMKAFDLVLAPYAGQNRGVWLAESIRRAEALLQPKYEE
jgi:predicted O-methyltransferase YrrM